MGGRLKDKVALVTGGASGIGEATARLFAQEGARVMIADLDAENGERVAAEIAAGGAEAGFVRADAAREPDARSAVDAAVRRFGRLDVLVNDAGMRVWGPVTEATEESWDAIIAVNLKGIAFFCKAAVPEMARNGGGSIVNVSSANGICARKGMAQYDATKAAVLGLTRAMACDHAEAGIRVNAVCPGPTVTQFHVRRTGRSAEEMLAQPAPQTILNRQARPREIACGILFLACDESSYVTGESLMVDGGYSAR